VKKAEKILVYADVLISGKERMLGAVAIHPHLDELEKIYLWGMQV
jgi:hypothetical protein